MKRMIEKVLEADVRPILLSHEGNVEVVDYNHETGILKIRLTGQCSGCPSAQITTEEIIAERVKSKIKEVKQVILVNEISEELISMAKAMLKKRHKEIQKG